MWRKIRGSDKLVEREEEELAPDGCQSLWKIMGAGEGAAGPAGNHRPIRDKTGKENQPLAP